MNVRWEDYVWKEPHPAGPAEIEKLEVAWGVRLPREYKEIACIHHGRAPQPDVFDVGGITNVFNNLLTLVSEEDEKSYSSIARAYRLMRPHVPHGIFPFGRTPGGEYLCFDYRDTLEEPRVVLVSTEMYIYPVANSFREFLEGLYEPSDEGAGEQP